MLTSSLVLGQALHSPAGTHGCPTEKTSNTLKSSAQQRAPRMLTRPNRSASSDHLHPTKINAHHHPLHHCDPWHPPLLFTARRAAQYPGSLHSPWAQQLAGHRLGAQAPQEQHPWPPWQSPRTRGAARGGGTCRRARTCTPRCAGRRRTRDGRAAGAGHGASGALQSVGVKVAGMRRQWV